MTRRLLKFEGRPNKFKLNKSTEMDRKQSWRWIVVASAMVFIHIQRHGWESDALVPPMNRIRTTTATGRPDRKSYTGPQLQSLMATTEIEMDKIIDVDPALRRVDSATTAINHTSRVTPPQPSSSSGPEDQSPRLRTVLTRAFQYVSIFQEYFGVPVVASLWEARNGPGAPTDWHEFWELPITRTTPTTRTTVAQQFTTLLEKLGPTFVKFGQALSSRPDVVDVSLAIALSKLQDQMETDDTSWNRREMVQEFLTQQLWNSTSKRYFRNEEEWSSFINSLSAEPVAAASIGVVYSGYVPIYDDTTPLTQMLSQSQSKTERSFQKVAIKLQRPGIADIVQQDAQLLHWVAQLLEALPSWPFKRNDATTSTKSSRRLIETDLTGAVGEFMSRIIEELDYRNEAKNIEAFASLYSHRKRNNGDDEDSMDDDRLYQNSAKGRSKIEVVVPHLYKELCTDKVLVMEWIEGTKLADLRRDDRIEPSETLDLIQQGIDCTLSQLLDTGVMHADPHGGNLIKVQSGYEDDGPSMSATYRLGYIDFGLLSSIPLAVQDGLVCAVVQLVFAKNATAVADLFGELQLLPDQVMKDHVELAALAEELNSVLSLIIVYDEEDGTAPPTLRFDKLLDVLTRLVPRFQFQLPPYFLNNARALGTLEGMARQADPNFNVLRNLYPYAIERLLYNPTQSHVVDATLNSLVESPRSGKVDVLKMRKLVEDISNYSGYSKRKVTRDIILSPNGYKLIQRLARETTIGAASRVNGRRGLDKLVEYLRL